MQGSYLDTSLIDIRCSTYFLEEVVLADDETLCTWAKAWVEMYDDELRHRGVVLAHALGSTLRKSEELSLPWFDISLMGKFEERTANLAMEIREDLAAVVRNAMIAAAFKNILHPDLMKHLYGPFYELIQTAEARKLREEPKVEKIKPARVWN